MASWNNISLSELSPGTTTQSAISAKSAPVDNSIITSYVLPDLSCLNNVPESIREEIMRHVVPMQMAAPVTCSTCPCYLLKKIPIEIRKEIYRYLLINPILSEYSSIKPEDGFGSELAYGLSPNIIRACKQINVEASQILYENNVFFMGDAHPSTALGYEWLPLFSPLTRFSRKISFSAISKVRRWKIASTGSFRTENSAITALTRFCFAISCSKLQSVELLLCPLLMEHYRSHYDELFEFLRPFRVLRNIKSFQARDAILSEMPDFQYDDSRTSWSRTAAILDVNGADAKIRDLQAMVQGSTPAPSLGYMYNSLLRYVIAFDHAGPFHSILEKRLLLGPDNTTPFKPPRPTHMRGCTCGTTEFERFHPNGKHLLDAELQIEEQDIDGFKRLRSKIIDSLEPQYERIVAASLRLVEFIKQEKRNGGSFASTRPQDTSGWGFPGPHTPSAALILLEDYSNSIQNRDIPSDIRLNRMAHQNCSDDCAAPWYWSAKSSPLRREHIQYFRGFEHFKAGVDDFDSQYLKIRQARKELYKWDPPGDIESRIQVDAPPPLCDEMVDWNRDEPDLGPKYENGMMFFYPGDS